ncbi:MAG: PPC domain-containing protein, partial [Candidatus Hodarchaeota archaeon]
GETYIGALPVIIGTYITGEIHKWDRDLYSFPVVKDQVYSVELFNLTGNLNLFITDENGTIFNQSARTGHLPEKAIFKAQSSGYYFIRIEDKTPGRYVLVVQEKSEASLFSLQPAFLTGKMGSSLIDSNSNNLFDELLFSIEINVSEAGKYNFWYSIAQNYSDYHFGKYVFMWDWLNLTLAEGIQNLSISIPGGILESSKYNGSYIINELALGKNNFSQVLNYDLEAYTTPIHEYTSFEPLNNRLNSFNVEMKDIDGNKVPEKIKIDLEFEFTIIGAYAIAIPIWNENQNELLAYNNKTFFVSQSGLTTITIEFVIQRFHKVGSIVLFGVAGSWYDYLIPVFNPISKETLLQSDPIIDYIVTDSLIDSDNDQKPDMIRFNIEITSKIELKINIFTGHPFSNPNETMILISSSKQSISIKKGSNDLWIDFDARILKAKELSGPFFFPNFGIRIKDYEFNLYFPYVTNEYTSSSFELPEVWLSSFFGGTKFKNSTNAGLEFTWEIGSTYQGKMTFEFEVREYEPLQGTFTKAINFTKQINIGTFNITSRIEAEYLFHSNYIGSLELYFACIYYLDSQDGLKHRFQENNLTVVDFVFHAGILPDVDYKDYTAYVDAYFTRSPEIKTAINASNGRYDGILVNVTLGINRVGTYELIVNLFSKNDYLIQNITKKTKLFASETGNRSISFLFSAKIIVRNSFNKVVYGNVTITNLDTLNKSGLNIPHFIIDNDNFNYKLPVYLISIVSDYTLDDDQDGKLDAIIVEMSVNVSKENDYRFSIEVYAQLNDFYEAYLGKIAISSKYFLVNLHSISFIIPYYYFLDVSQEAEDLHKLPIIEIFFMPIYMFDDEGQFTASSEPIFLKNSYDLRDFNTQPLAIGYFRITQEDINGDGISDQLGVNVAIIVHSILNYSLQVTIEVFWGKSANTLEKVIYYYPITTGIAYKTISFAFSEIFSSSNPPRHFSAKASISVVSLDGIEIDTYVTPVDILFYYESSSEITTSMITTSTEMSSQSKAYLEVFYTILAFLGVTGVKTIRDRKYRRKKEKMNYLN